MLIGRWEPTQATTACDSREYVKTRRSLGRPAAPEPRLERVSRPREDSRKRLLHFDFSTRGWLPLKTPGTPLDATYVLRLPGPEHTGSVRAAHPSTFFNRLGEPITRRDAMRATRSAVGTSQHAAKPRYVCSMYQTVITTEYAQQSPTILDTDVPATTALGHVRGSRTDPSGALSRRDSRRGRHRPLRAGCDGGR